MEDIREADDSWLDEAAPRCENEVGCQADSWMQTVRVLVDQRDTALDRVKELEAALVDVAIWERAKAKVAQVGPWCDWCNGPHSDQTHPAVP